MTNPRAVSTPPSAPRVAQTSQRVLIVDDEASIRDAVGRFLRSRGFDVHVADTVATGLDRLRATRFAALVCDVRMPGASGMDLIPEALRLDANLAIVMLTGLNDATVATEALTLGAADYLLKPVELDRLEKSVARALRIRSERIEQQSLEQRIRDEVARLAAHGECPSADELASMLKAVLTALETRANG